MAMNAKQRALATITVAESIDFYKSYAVVHMRNTKTTIKIVDLEEIKWLWELSDD
jgi:hypothetical protein